jgi:tetratricopeptide (TPR) repeat protein
LRLDARNPDAIAARSIYVPFGNHWLETERRLRAGLREVPDSGVMNGFLGMDLSAVGRTREAIGALDHAVAGARFVPILRGYLVSALFAAGRIGDADHELEAAAALWPRFADLWWQRFWIFAFTGRLDAATTHITIKARYPVELAPAEVDAARLAIKALADRSPVAIDAALAAWTSIAQRTKGHWRAVISLAAMLARIETAFEMTRRFLAPFQAVPLGAVPGTGFLFSAPLAPLHDQDAFWEICREVGLERYWRESRSRPDIAGHRAS